MSSVFGVWVFGAGALWVAGLVWLADAGWGELTALLILPMMNRAVRTPPDQTRVFLRRDRLLYPPYGRCLLLA